MKYRYTMSVVEQVHSSTVIESERKMTYGQLEKEPEKRRKAGKLSLDGVEEVQIWCDAAYKNGCQGDHLRH